MGDPRQRAELLLEADQRLRVGCPERLQRHAAAALAVNHGVDHTKAPAAQPAFDDVAVRGELPASAARPAKLQE